MNRDVMPYRPDIIRDRGINYRAEPFAEREDASSNLALDSKTHGDPRTPLLIFTEGDPVRLHVTQGFGQQPHVFAIDGHRFPFEPSMPDAMNLYARQFGPMAVIDAVLEGNAGGLQDKPGDYLYRDGRNPFFEGGLWGIMRVLPRDETRVLPLGPDLVPGWNLVSRHVVPDSTAVAEFLTSIEGDFDRVAATDSDNPAEFLTFSPASVNNTLSILDNTMGFWIHMTDAAFFSVPGTLPSTVDISLRQGWNLVGWPTPRTMPIDQALASIAGQFDLVYAFEASDSQDPWKVFDPVAPAFASDLSVIKPLRGYWIHMTEPGILTIGP